MDGINENTLHSIKLMLVEGSWVRSDGDGVKRVEIKGSNLATTANETLKLLRSFHLK